MKKYDLSKVRLSISAITISAIFVAGICTTCNKEVAGSRVETTTETEITTEPTTEEQTTTEIITADFECIIREVVGNTITVEHNGNLYNFYGNGYAEGQRVICTFTEDMKVIDASEPIAEETTTEIKFYDVPLSEELQLHIMTECKKHNISPALIIAMIERESDFRANTIGDNGNSFGLMQIQPKWHKARMDKLGVTDLLDPYQNVTVGIDLVASLFAKYGDNIYMVLMEYNGGLGYANRMANNGKISDYALTIVARAEELDNE